METLFGVHPVLEALRARRRVLRELRLRGARGVAHERARALARAAGVSAVELASREFERGLPEGARHQGVALLAGALPEQTLEELLAGLDAAASPAPPPASASPSPPPSSPPSPSPAPPSPSAGSSASGSSPSPSPLPPLVVALDGVEDPRNVGGIARVADGAGAAALLLTTRRAPPLTPALSAGECGGD